jgi:hypothetical protein
VHEPGGAAALDPASQLDLKVPVSNRQERELVWRRVVANAEGIADLSPFLGVNADQPAYAFTPVVSPLAQEARLVLDTPANVSVWLNGQQVPLSARNENANEPRSALVLLRRGTNPLLIRMTREGQPNAQAALVTTLVTERPVGFTSGESSLSARGTTRP